MLPSTTAYSIQKGTAALLASLGNVLAAASGSWHIVFVAAAVMNAVAAIAALALLQPLRSSLGPGGSRGGARLRRAAGGGWSGSMRS
jgi:OFA family oxalate/formate antiporter-like MFS transporter